MRWLSWRMLLIVLVAAAAIEKKGGGASGQDVTYDGRSLIIHGQRKILFSGSIHYPRSTPQMWHSLIRKAKEGGIDVIQTYVFWNLHEPRPGQYNFNGRYDLVKFIKAIQAQGLHACLRIGPFIEAEWTYGGFPFWLHDVPGIVYRSDNEPFKYYMKNFTTKVVNLMKSENLYASQGGPILLSQIENEYPNAEPAFHEKGPPYVRWAAKMAVDLQTGVPWIMCKQPDAPDPVINTCNGMRCGETFTGPNSPTKPSLWTENWTSFYQVFGGEPYIRTAEDIAFHTTLFIAKKKGSYVNYYMYHGGTNFGRNGAYYMIPSYYDEAPLDEYGMIRQPKYGHLKEMHAAIKSCSTTLLEGVQNVLSLGDLQQAYVYEYKAGGGCAAFLVNNDHKKKVNVKFLNKNFELLPKSISILPDCQNIIFNTAKVNAGYNKRVVTSTQVFDNADGWKQFIDVIPSFGNSPIKANTLLEQMGTTKDKSDYLWYTFNFQPRKTCSQPVLHVESLAHVAYAFVNRSYAGSAHGVFKNGSFILEVPITLNPGTDNNISILSVLVGLQDGGAHLEMKYAGLTRVEVKCSEKEVYDLTKNYNWGNKVGLVGEKLGINYKQYMNNVDWKRLTVDKIQPLTWFKFEFEPPAGRDPVALDLSKMGKGQAWVNGYALGRYWVSYLTPKGQPSQTLYNIPRSFLRIKNVLVILEEEPDRNPLSISLHTVSTTASSFSEHKIIYSNYNTL